MFIIGIVSIGVDGLSCSFAYGAECLFAASAYLMDNVRNLVVIGEIAFEVGRGLQGAPPSTLSADRC